MILSFESLICRVCQQRRSLFPVVLALCWSGLSMVRTFAADDDVDESAVRRWIVRLDANRKADRDEAKKELLKLGPAALKWLPEPESLGGRATVEAVRDVRAKLERQKAEESVNAVRLTPAGSPLVGETLLRLTKEMGNVVVAEDLPKELLSKPVELPERPTFWDVIESTSRQHELSWSYVGSPARLRLFPMTTATTDESPRAVLAATQSKAFRIALKSIRERKVVGQESDPLLRLEVDVMSEPRLRPLFLKCAVADVAVSSERKSTKGQQLWRPYSPDAKLELTFGQGHRQMSVPLDYRRPAGDWDSLTVSGKLHLETAAGEEPLQFPPGAEARNVSRRRGGVTVKVLRWESGGANENGLNVTALVTYDTGGPAFESHRSWMLFNVAGLVRAGMMSTEKPVSGTTMNDVSLLKPTHIDSDVQPDGSIAVTYRFEKLPLPASEYRFRYVAPTLILDVPLEFELRDVPLRSGR
jgi:hypothetical protein